MTTTKRDPGVGAVDLLAAFRPETAKPEDVEQLIDLRVARIDEELAAIMAKKDELQAERKRWVGVTGGRSRVNGTPETVEG